MKSIAHALTALLSLTLVSTTLAQTGVLDQANPYPPAPPIQTAGYNGDTPSLVWQQQVRAGLTGQLEGFELYLNGTAGSTINARVRLGDAWNNSPVLFQTVVVKPGLQPIETVFVDCTAANVQVTSGATFVIELQGNSDGGGFAGSYAPVPNNPTYPEDLFLGPNATACFSDCRWRMGFNTYVLDSSPPVTYCTSGTTSSGCTAQIDASEQPSVSGANPCAITVTNVEGQKSGIVFYGLEALPQPWCPGGAGSSFLCVKPPTQRSFPQSSGGSLNACDGQLALDWNAFQAGTPGALGSPWSAGDKAYVQAWFRDPLACRTTSLSDAIELTYAP